MGLALTTLPPLSLADTHVTWLHVRLTGSSVVSLLLTVLKRDFDEYSNTSLVITS